MKFIVRCIEGFIILLVQLKFPLKTKCKELLRLTLSESEFTELKDLQNKNLYWSIE